MATYWPYLLLVPVLLVMQYGVVLREEAYLERKFGEDYRRLKQTVPRWIGLPKV
jgi:protein-S-isoprenylcysteine O-methyltransferase Ste14